MMDVLNSFSFFANYLEVLDPLPDDVRLSLYDAIARYAIRGQEPELEPLAMAVFQALRPSIDKSRSHGKAGKTESNKIKTNQNESNEIKTNQILGKEKEEKRKEKKENINTSPLPPPGGTTASELIEQEQFPDEVEKAVKDWTQYKTEKRQAYKPTGFKSFLSVVRRKLEEYGQDAVVDIIRESMGANWQGVAWERLNRNRAPTRQSKEQAAQLMEAWVHDG